MRELYKYKPGGSSSATNSAAPSSIVAKAVAKIEKDDDHRRNKKSIINNPNDYSTNKRRASKNNSDSAAATSDAFEVSCGAEGGAGECPRVERKCAASKCQRELASDSQRQLGAAELRNLCAASSCADVLEKSDDFLGFSYKRLQERTTPYDFETALEDFDRTAKDVLTFVQQRSDHLLSRNICEEIANNTSLDNQTSNHISSSDDDEGTSDDSDSDRADDSSVSGKDARDIANEGLPTIAEECAGAQTATSVDETDDSEQEEKDSTPIQLCTPSAVNTSKAPTWIIDLEEEDRSSTTDSNKSMHIGSGDSSTETEDIIIINDSKDSSTRCNGDFKWIRKDPPKKPNLTMDDTDDELDTSSGGNNNNSSSKCLSGAENQQNNKTKPPINNHNQKTAVSKRHRRSLAIGQSEKAISPPCAGGSLDRRHHAHAHQTSRCQLKNPPPPPPPPKLDDYTTINHRAYSPSASLHAPISRQSNCQNWCGCHQSANHNLATNPFAVDQGQSSMYHFNHPHQRRSADRFGSGPISMDGRGSHPDLYRGRHDTNHGVLTGGCCQYHGVLMAPPIGGCCGGYHWLPPVIKPAGGGGGDLEDRCRKLHSERDNLQLQVQVLSEQIEAQCDRIVDLERRLADRKQALSNTEDILQRETLSRSSLETQKLELLSQISELKLHQASIERENLELRCHYNNNNNSSNDHHHHHGNTARKQLPAYLHRMSPQPTTTTTVATSTPVHQNNQGVAIRTSPSPSPVNIFNMASPSRQQDAASPKTPPPPATYKRHIELHYSSLPRQQYLSNGATLTLVNSASLHEPQQQHCSGQGQVGGAASQLQQQHRGGFGRLAGGILLAQYSGVHAGLRHKGHSVPNLADTEKVIIGDNASALPASDTNDLQQQSFNNNNSNNKGIKKIFSKLKRSGSGNLDDLPPGLGVGAVVVGEFQRGGVRATASPRLGWTEPQITKKPPSVKPFADWETSHLCEWFSDLGLDQYVAEAKRWLKSGQQLQEASAADYEKELQMKSSLHRKKLQLALIDAEANGSSDTLLAQAGTLDTSWVLRWLDDVGLPQYKESFLQQRIDGRVLHRLTMDDLATLHVTSALHSASLRRGIQVLRECKYDASCLQRRAVDDDEEEEEEEEDGGAVVEQDGNGGGEPKKQNSRSAREISLWTSHRVMQWLREVDLAEYAPNLRGAGVHGAIMVLEQRFTADLLAALLSISPSKTLLRRHLNTRFKELLGADLIQAKREAEGVLGYIALTPQAKLKVAKKSHFSLKRSKSKSEADYGDLVCPMNAAGQSGQDLNGSAINSSMGMTRKIRGKEEDAYQHDDQSNSYPQSAANSPLPLRYESS